MLYVYLMFVWGTNCLLVHSSDADSCYYYCAIARLITVVVCIIIFWLY